LEGRNFHWLGRGEDSLCYGKEALGEEPKSIGKIQKKLGRPQKNREKKRKRGGKDANLFPFKKSGGVGGEQPSLGKPFCTGKASLKSVKTKEAN